MYVLKTTYIRNSTKIQSSSNYQICQGMNSFVNLFTLGLSNSTRLVQGQEFVMRAKVPQSVSKIILGHCSEFIMSLLANWALILFQL